MLITLKALKSELKILKFQLIRQVFNVLKILQFVDQIVGRYSIPIGKVKGNCHLN